MRNAAERVAEHCAGIERWREHAAAAAGSECERRRDGLEDGEHQRMAARHVRCEHRVDVVVADSENLRKPNTDDAYGAETGGGFEERTELRRLETVLDEVEQLHKARGPHGGNDSEYCVQTKFGRRDQIECRCGE